MVLPMVQDSTDCAPFCRQHKLVLPIVLVLLTDTVVLLIVFVSTAYLICLSYLCRLSCVDVKIKSRAILGRDNHYLCDFYVSRSRVPSSIKGSLDDIVQ